MALPTALAGIGLETRLTGWKLASNTCTKFDGKSPIARLSLRNRPIHQEPSPAFKHSMRSPSTKPRSRFDSPPHEYVARHQQGNRVGRLGAACSMIAAVGRKVFDEVGMIKEIAMSCASVPPGEMSVVRESHSNGL